MTTLMKSKRMAQMSWWFDGDTVKTKEPAPAVLAAGYWLFWIMVLLCVMVAVVAVVKKMQQLPKPGERFL